MEQQQGQPMQEGQQMPPQQGMARGGAMYYDGGGTVRPLTEQEAINAMEWNPYPRKDEFEDQFYNVYTGSTGSTSVPFANNTLTTEEQKKADFVAKYSQPGQITSDLITASTNEKGNQDTKENLTSVLTFNPKAVDNKKDKKDNKNNTTSTTTAQSKTPKGSNMSATDLAFMAAQLAGPASQFFQKKPEAFQYKKGEAKTLDPSTAIMLADQGLKESEAGAGYAIRQASPTAGSYLANIRANALDFGKKRGQSSAGIRGQYDLQNAGILNQFEQYNTELTNKATDAMQQDQANYQEQRTNALYNAGANLAGMRKDYNAGEIDKLIANNIGTSNYKYDQTKQTITYKKPDGKEVTVPVSTVLGGNTTT
jgi:hypothetical protein